MRIVMSEEEFLVLGLSLLNFSDLIVQKSCRNTNIERFKDGFHASPLVVKVIFDDLQDEEDVEPRGLLLGMFYLKKYPTKHSLVPFINESERTALKMAHDYVEKLQSLKPRKV